MKKVFFILLASLFLTEIELVFSAILPQRLQGLVPCHQINEHELKAKRRFCYKPWTVLIYMAANNDLGPYALWDIYEMEAGYASNQQLAGSSRRSDIITYLDTPEEGAKILHIQQSNKQFNSNLGFSYFKDQREMHIQSPILKSLNNSYVERPENEKLENFLNWGFQEFPSVYTMVIIWGHGKGWIAHSERNNDNPYNLRNSIIFSENNQLNNSLSTPQLRQVLKNVSKNTLANEEVNVFIADSCLMQTIEVAFEISDYTQYVIGSTQIQNFLGLPYRRIFYHLNNSQFDGYRNLYPTATEDYLAAKMIPSIFQKSFQSRGYQRKHSPRAIENVSMSAISSAELRNWLVPELNQLGKVLSLHLKEDPLRAIAIERIFQHTLPLPGGTQEIGVFLSMLNAFIRSEIQRETATPLSYKLLQQVSAVRESLHRTAVHYVLPLSMNTPSESPQVMGAKSISIWLPTSVEEFEIKEIDFSLSRFSAHTPALQQFFRQLYIP